MAKTSNKILNKVIFLGFGLSGMAALIYEVVWTRSLSTIMGSSTYALSTMLAAFMAGLAFGGWIGGYISQKTTDLPKAFALAELGIGIAGFLTIPVIKYMTPLYMFSFYTFHLSFNTFSFIQFLICFLIMGIPTSLMGLTFPIVIKFFTSGRPDEIGKLAGRLYSINTFGAIIGSLAAGFLLIPIIGGQATALTAATINITTALVILTLSKHYRQSAASVLIVMVFAFASAFLHKPDVPFFSFYSAQRFGSYDFAKRVLDSIESARDSYVLYEHEGTDGTVYLAKSPDPREQNYVLLNNGKFESGNDVSFALLAYIPFLSHDKEDEPLKALNIGLGSGHTLRHLSKLPLAKIDSVELSEGVLEANRRFLNPDLFNNPKINHFNADGRNYMLLGPETYDIIVASPSWAVETSSAGMLTEEFFSLAFNRLHWHGVFAIWLDDFVEHDEEMATILRTISKEFEHVALWTTDGGKILVGSKTPLLHYTEQIYAKASELSPALAGKFNLYMNENDIDRLPDGPINTDDRPLIEFSNAQNIIIGSLDQKGSSHL
jgi:spermidine synthase